MSLWLVSKFFYMIKIKGHNITKGKKKCRPDVCQCLNIVLESEYFEKCILSGISMHSFVIPEYKKTVVIMKKNSNKSMSLWLHKFWQVPRVAAPQYEEITL